MQETTTLLSIIRQRGEHHLPLCNVYRLLYNRNLYLTAYGKLRRNHGAMTEGSTEETIDAMSLAKIDHIIELLRHEKHRWTPLRRAYRIKPNGKRRPLGLPTWSDKLLQEVIRLLLEAYYEPQFNRRSHGFRPGRGCHTALAEIQQIWTGTRWFIEGDIAQCFDSLDHALLLELLTKHIEDQRFIQLIRRLLQAGYLEDWTYHATLSGTPQGNVLSPLLSNIYLHEFDQYVTGTLIPQYSRGDHRKTDPAYQHMCYRLWYLKDKPGHQEEVRTLIKERRQLSSKDPQDPDYRRLWYARYADDFLLGYIGSHAEAEEIKANIKTWLRDHLRVTLSDEKTIITHAIDTSARFLGYEIINQQCNTKCTAGKRSVNGRIALRVPYDVITKKCQPYLHHGEPIHRPERQANTDYSLIADYQQEYRGIVQYYLLATNINDLSKLHHVTEVSLLKTLAAKYRIGVAKAAARYDATVVGPDGKARHCLEARLEREGRPPLVARFGGIPLQRQPTATIMDQPLSQYPHYTELEKRVRANTCEACGSNEQVEVHHIHRLADLKRNNGRPIPARKQTMMARQRKTLVLCRTCHKKLHNGQFDNHFGMRC